MNPQRSATLAAAFYPTVVIAGWAIVNLAGMPSPPRIETSAAAHVVERVTPALAANIELAAAPKVTAAPVELAAASQVTIVAAPPAVTMTYAAPGTAEVATAAEFVAKPVTDTTPAPETTAAFKTQEAFKAPEASKAPEALDTKPAPDQPQPIVVASLGDPAEVLSPEVPLVPAPSASTADAQPQDAAPAVRRERVELVGECVVIEPCIDQYLFALYQRTPKEDSIKETEKRKVTVKRKGKTITVTRSFTKLVENDFTWKDPKAAERVGMSMSDYVIGGMDRSFKLKLFQMLYAAENAGLQPGITSAFRDDYRQSIAAGLKAAANRSYHGGSSRGGYGRGLAADIVSVNGNNRAQRWASTEAFWKWVDANGKQFGIGRPYLGRDPPHVGPVDGQEYVSKRGGTRVASADVKKRATHTTHVAHAKPAAAKRAVAAKPSSGKPTSRLAAVR